jgi:transposase
MKKRQKLLTDEQWELVGAMLPPPRRRRDNRGRPWASNRACFEGILWILQTGAAWRFLPDEFPSPSTCWRRLKQWEEEGVWLDAWRTRLNIASKNITLFMGQPHFCYRCAASLASCCVHSHTSPHRRAGAPGQFRA